MLDDLTMAEFDMLDDAIFQRAADAPTERVEERWLTLRSKVQRAAFALERQACSCAHARRAHRGNGHDRCIICHCRAFDLAPGGGRGPTVD